MKCTLFRLAQDAMAPSLNESSGFGTMSAGSNSAVDPSPSQCGQAPWGELNEKLAGVNSG